MSTRSHVSTTLSLLLCLSLPLAGCPGDDIDGEETREQGRCPQGFFEADGGRHCAPWIPREACAPGFTPRLGEDECLAVGHTSCREGFEPDPSGWGCRDVSPTEPCRGFAREALGSSSCLPVGDCLRTFPPEEASIFVDETLSVDDPSEGRFRTVTAAIAAAAEGDVIAIFPGSYREAPLIEKSVTLIGVCPDQVTIRTPRTGATGIMVQSSAEVGLQGMTILGFVGGVMAQQGATVHIKETVLDGNLWVGAISAGSGTSMFMEDSVVKRTIADTEDPWGMGLAAYQGGALHLDSVTVADSVGAGIYVTSPGSTAHLRDTVVIRTKLDAETENNAGIYLQNGGSLEAEGLLLAENHAMGLVMYDAGTRADISQAVIRDSQLDSEGVNGMGLGVWQGASLALSDATLAGNVTVALHVENAQAEVHRVVLRSTSIPDIPVQFGEGTIERIGAGLVASQGALLSIDESAILDSFVFGFLAADEGTQVQIDACLVADTKGDVPQIWGTGIGLLDQAVVEISRTASMGHDGAGVMVSSGSQLQMVDSLVLGTGFATPPPREALGLAVSSGANVNTSRVAILKFQIAGVLLHGGGSICHFEDGRIADTRPREGEEEYGFNVGVIEDAVLHLVRSDVMGGERTGLSFWGGSGTIDGGAIMDNQIAINVERGTSVEEVSSVGGEFDRREVRVSSATRFEGNETKLGAVPLALPISPIEGAE